MGEVAFELFIRVMQILNEAYVDIAKTLYFAESPFDGLFAGTKGARELLQLLSKGRQEVNVRISKFPPSGETPEESGE